MVVYRGADLFFDWLLQWHPTPENRQDDPTVTEPGQRDAPCSSAFEKRSGN